MRSLYSTEMGDYLETVGTVNNLGPLCVSMQSAANKRKKLSNENSIQ